MDDSWVFGCHMSRLSFDLRYKLWLSSRLKWQKIKRVRKRFPYSLNMCFLINFKILNLKKKIHQFKIKISSKEEKSFKKKIFKRCFSNWEKVDLIRIFVSVCKIKKSFFKSGKNINFEYTSFKKKSLKKLSNSFKKLKRLK